MISWAHLAQPPEWLVAFWPIAFSNACPRLGVVNPVLAVGAVLWDELPH
jgi:hypothetical protein